MRTRPRARTRDNVTPATTAAAGQSIRRGDGATNRNDVEYLVCEGHTVYRQQGTGTLLLRLYWPAYWASIVLHGDVCRLSSVTLPACGPAGRRARGRPGGRHCAAGQYGYVPLWRHFVFTSRTRRQQTALGRGHTSSMTNWNRNNVLRILLFTLTKRKWKYQLHYRRRRQSRELQTNSNQYIHTYCLSAAMCG